jgi:hypothetical protein
MKLIFASVAAAAIAIAAPAKADAITYTLNSFTVASGPPSSPPFPPNTLTVSGTITTDGTLGQLSTANITNWSITILKGGSFWDTFSNGQALVTGDALSATNDQLLFNFASTPVDRLFIGNTFEQVTWTVGSTGAHTAGIALSFQTCFTNCAGEIVGNGLMPIASIAPVPGPIVGAGFPGLVAMLGWLGYGRFRRKLAAG